MSGDHRLLVVLWAQSSRYGPHFVTAWAEGLEDMRREEFERRVRFAKDEWIADDPGEDWTFALAHQRIEVPEVFAPFAGTGQEDRT